MKNLIIALIVIAAVIFGIYFVSQRTPVTPPADTGPIDSGTSTSTPPIDTGDTGATSTAPVLGKSVIGRSVEGRDINAYSYGTGDKEVLFVGGIHGGYSPNTAAVAFDLVDYLDSTPSALPAGVRVTVIPVLNPDGLNKVVGTPDRFEASDVPSARAERVPGRFNANNVDLNRNFDCDWQAQGTWQNTPVSGGTAAFSEPESQAIRDYVENHDLAAVVVWYSAAGGVFASNCHGGVLPETKTLTDLYSKASGYPAYDEFDFYEITGDMVNWLAKENIPGISVLLTTHNDAEWSKNKLGIDTLLAHYAAE